MAPVAHGDGQRRPAGRVRVFCVERRLCAQRRYGVFHNRNVRSVRYRPACNVPAAQHQLRVVQFFQRRLFFRERLHHAAGSVIQQHHDMRRFQRRAPAHGKARRNTLHNGIFAGTHQRCGAFFIAVSLQVHSAHKALPHTALRRAFHIYKTVDTACEHPGAVIGHGGVDGRNATVHIRAFQICLRQGDVQCAGRVLSASAFCQYSGWLVNWSHASAGHRPISVCGAGSKISAAINGFIFVPSVYQTTPASYP